MVTCCQNQGQKERRLDLLPKFLGVLLLFLGVPGLQAAPRNATALTVEVKRSRERQVMEGFGGALAFWGYDADEEALRYGFDDLGATIVRVPGEVQTSGSPEEYRAVLRRVARIAPKAQVLLSFWQ